MPESEEPANSNIQPGAEPGHRRPVEPIFIDSRTSSLNYQRRRDPPDKYQPQMPVLAQILIGIVLIIVLGTIAAEGPPKYFAPLINSGDYALGVAFIGIGIILFMRLKYRWRGLSGLFIAILCILTCLFGLLWAICSGTRL